MKYNSIHSHDLRNDRILPTLRRLSVAFFITRFVKTPKMGFSFSNDLVIRSISLYFESSFAICERRITAETYKWRMCLQFELHLMQFGSYGHRLETRSIILAKAHYFYTPYASIEPKVPLSCRCLLFLVFEGSR